jgi:hypothetical protein
MREATQRLLLVLSMAAVLPSCGYPGVPVPPQLELPKPVSDLRAVRKGDKVYLSWTVPTLTTDRQTLRHLGPTRICRSFHGSLKECGVQAGEAMAPVFAKGGPPKKNPPKLRAAYADSLPSSATTKLDARVTYAVEVLNDSLRTAGLSNQATVSGAPTLPPPSDFAAQITADGVLLRWKEVVPQSTPPDLRYAYRIYRRLEGGDKDVLVAEVAAGSDQFVDHSFEWQKTYNYRMTVVTLLSVSTCAEGEPSANCNPAQAVEGADTPGFQVFANDTFSPSIPVGLQAVFSGVGQRPFIDLVWTPVPENDLAGYNIYRHEEGMPPARVNSELVKTTAFRDSGVESGRKYFYSVSAVDLRGNESARSEEANEVVP